MAISLEYGKCASCGRENPKAIEQCRGCNSVLPWVKGAPPAANGKAGANSGSTPKQGIGIGDVAWGGIGMGLVGGLIFVAGIVLWCGNVFGFLPTLPGAGYVTMLVGGALWRFGGSMDD